MSTVNCHRRYKHWTEYDGETAALAVRARSDSSICTESIAISIDEGEISSGHHSRQKRFGLRFLCCILEPFTSFFAEPF